MILEVPEMKQAIGEYFSTHRVRVYLCR